MRKLKHRLKGSTKVVNSRAGIQTLAVWCWSPRSLPLYMSVSLDPEEERNTGFGSWNPWLGFTWFSDCAIYEETERNVLFLWVLWGALFLKLSVLSLCPLQIEMHLNVNSISKCIIVAFINHTLTFNMPNSIILWASQVFHNAFLCSAAIKMASDLECLKKKKNHIINFNFP